MCTCLPFLSPCQHAAGTLHHRRNTGGLGRLTTLKGVAGVGDHPAGPLVQRMWVQCLRERGSSGAPPPGVKAHFPAPLVGLSVAWLNAAAEGDPSTAAERRQYACWLILGFFGMLRRSDPSGLKIGEVESVPGGGVRLWVAKSKTDQRGAGAEVLLAATSGSRLPIQNIVARHLQLVAQEGAAAQHPLFCRGAKWGARLVGLSKGDFSVRLRRLLAEPGRAYSQLNLDASHFLAHSLRKGGATKAAQGGVSLEDIKRHSRWRSAAVMAYIQPDVTSRLQLVERM
ncbi:hypothetical protein Vafri_14319 [Volvox africanus]|uniref:Tyr recombinase domain-containing protein n=1 Tax=Volvox africanus TaxID=51714 RepID=A0A8J4F4M5_9CHLO|nr:hypothetical protein Vafri_14319 [Volvox africanus]